MKDKPVNFKKKGRVGSRACGIVEDEVYEMVSDYKHMLQRIRFNKGESWDGSAHAYRMCYYKLAADGRTIKFGQYPSFLTQSELTRLLGKARRRGWLV
jgi:hypothetical protein